MALYVQELHEVLFLIASNQNQNIIPLQLPPFSHIHTMGHTLLRNYFHDIQI